MDRREPPSIDSLDDERGSPDYLRRGDAATESIDLNSLFSKPFDMGQLLQTVRKVLDDG
ncbi:MAG: hypothetical protein V1792_04225 [Pseudomonadota bacterium]